MKPTTLKKKNCNRETTLKWPIVKLQTGELVVVVVVVVVVCVCVGGGGGVGGGCLLARSIILISDASPKVHIGVLCLICETSHGNTYNKTY